MLNVHKNKCTHAYVVYILECEDGTLYTGITNDLERRFAAHKKGKGGRYTRAKGVVRVVYSEQQKSKSLALKREREIKGLTRTDKLNLIVSQ